MGYRPQLPTLLANTTVTTTAITTSAVVVGLTILPSTAAAGTVTLRDGGSSGTVKGVFYTGTAPYPVSIPIFGGGRVFENTVYVDTTNVAGVTIHYLEG